MVRPASMAMPRATSTDAEHDGDPRQLVADPVEHRLEHDAEHAEHHQEAGGQDAPTVRARTTALPGVDRRVLASSRPRKYER